MKKLSTEEFLYARIVAEFQEQIRQQVLKPGDKLPSLRSLSRDHGISLGTAYKTYMELESMGIVQSRLKSGYYLTFAASHFAKPQLTKPPARNSKPASIGKMFQMVYENLSDENILTLVNLYTSSFPLLLQPACI